MADENKTLAEDIRNLEELRSLLIKDLVRLAKGNDLTPTDRRTVVALLKESNMTLDPTQLPQSLRDKLSASLKPEDGLDEDADI